MERPPLGSSLGFAPRRPGVGRRTPGWGQAIEHGPGTTRSTSHRSISNPVVHSIRATSRRTSPLRSCDAGSREKESDRRGSWRDMIGPRRSQSSGGVQMGRLLLGDRSSARFGGRGRSSPPWDQHRRPARTTASIRALARRLQARDARLWRGGGQRRQAARPCFCLTAGIPGGNLGGFWIRQRAPVTARVPPWRRRRPVSSAERDSGCRLARVAGAVARPGSHRTVRTLVVYGSSGRRVMTPAAGRLIDLESSP